MVLAWLDAILWESIMRSGAYGAKGTRAVVYGKRVRLLYSGSIQFKIAYFGMYPKKVNRD